MKFSLTLILLVLTLVCVNAGIFELSVLFGLGSLVAFLYQIAKQVDNNNDNNRAKKTEKNEELNNSDIIFQESYKQYLIEQPKKARVEKRFNSEKSKTLAKIKRITLEHKIALAIERQKLVIKDPYGKENKTKWLKEGVEYFYKNVILPELRDFEIQSLGDYKNTDVFNDMLRPNIKPVKEVTINREIISIIENCSIEGIEELQKFTTYSETLTGQQYEHLCGNILKKYGWNIEFTKGSGDQGVDIIAQKDNVRIAIQCKKHKKPVSNKAIQEVLGGQMYYNLDKAAVIASNGYTAGAIKLSNISNVVLLSHNNLNQLDV